MKDFVVREMENFRGFLYLLQSLRMEDVSLLSFDFQVSRIENESRIIFINH